MDVTGYFKYQNFPTHFRLSLLMFWQNLTKSVKSVDPINSLNVVVFLLKSNAIFLANIGSQTTRDTPGDYFASWNRKPMGQLDLVASMTMDQDLTHCAHFFVFYLNRSVERWGRHNNKESCRRKRKNPAKWPALSAASTSRFHIGIFFSWQNGTFSFFFEHFFLLLLFFFF